MPRKKPLKVADASGTRNIQSFFSAHPLSSAAETSETVEIECSGDTPSKKRKVDQITPGSPADFEFLDLASTSEVPLPVPASSEESFVTPAASCSQPPVSRSSDIADYIGQAVSEQDKLHFLTDWSLPVDYSFPVTLIHGKNRKFQKQWLEANPWLIYSPSVDGMFCKVCALFVTDDTLGKFVCTPYKNWNKASGAMSSHSALKYHQDALAKAEMFIDAMKNPSKNITTQMDTKILKQIEVNRQVLASIVKIVVVAGRQGLALRGNGDDGVLQENNMSNFNALLELCIDSGDEVLREHLQTCSANATYISKTTQNRIIDIIGDIIRGQIIAEVKSAKQFTLMADEATDAGNWEQLSVVLRFVDSKKAIREEFLAFLQCESITGEALAHKILQCLNEWGLDASNIRGQGYDGAGNMAGKFKGVKARILEDNEKALYFHCAAHCLSLCVVKSCEIPQVRNMLGVLKDIAMFFNFSPKRQRKLEDVIDAALPDNKKTKLVNLCKTRWVEKHAAFESFADMYQVLYDCVGQMTEDREGWDADMLTSSSGFLHSLSNGEFLVAFVVVRKCLQYLKPLTVNLQKQALDIVAAYTQITDVSECISNLRSNVDTSFAAWFAEANQMSQDMIRDDIQAPRRVGRQVHRENHPADNVEEFYRRSIAIPFLDHLSRELQERFKNADLARDGLNLVPINVVQTPRGFTAVPDGVKCLANLWEEDLPDIDEIEPEFNRWCAKWHREQDSEGTVPSSAAEALQHCDIRFYPNLYKLLQLVCTLPITTSECERSISRLRTLKTYLRSTMGESRLNGLALMRIHRHIPVDIGAVVNAFATKYRTQMKLLPHHLLS